MVARIKIVAGNWKMHKTVSEARTYCAELRDSFMERGLPCEVMVAPPFPALGAAIEAFAGTEVKVAAQNVFWESEGAYTGEVSPRMLKEMGCSHVIIGHSERRQYFGETNRSVNKKILACLKEGVAPIFCIGETLEQRERGITFPIVKEQLIGGLQGVGLEDPRQLIIAYEPVWAIGTGKTASPEQAQEVHEYIRSQISELFDGDFAESMRILYGGSVKPENAKSLFTCKDIDGGLVGGASLKKADFVGIVYSGFIAE